MERLERGEPCTPEDVERARLQATAQAEALASARERLLHMYRSVARRERRGTDVTMHCVSPYRPDTVAGDVGSSRGAVPRADVVERLTTGLAGLLSWAGVPGPDEASRRRRWSAAIVAQCESPEWRGWARAVCAVAVTAFPAARGVAISVAGASGAELAAASDEWTSRLQELELIVGEGPSTTVHEGGSIVAVDDLMAEWHAWQGYAAASTDHDVHGVTAIPLRIHGFCVGALTIYRQAGSSALEPADLAAFADIAAAALLADLQSGEPESTAGAEWFSFHVATGVVAARLDVPVAEAQSRLRAHAFSAGMTLQEVAERTLTDELDLD